MSSEDSTIAALLTQLLIRRRSVMSRPTFEAPIISPSAFLMGDTVSDTSMIVPSFLRRFVS